MRVVDNFPRTVLWKLSPRAGFHRTVLGSGLVELFKLGHHFFHGEVLDVFQAVG